MTFDDNLPWPERYRPTTREQIVGNEESVDRLLKWIVLWTKRIPKKRAALLVGAPGIGKTASVMALTKDLDMELVEFNASDKRNKSTIETQVWRAATQETIDGRRRVILLDEVDGLSGRGDRGGVGAIVKIVKETLHPIIMTANDITKSSLKKLLRYCEVIQYQPISHSDMFAVLKRIIESQDKSIEETTLETIIEHSGGDMRAAISDLEKLVSGDTSEVDTVMSRDMKTPIIETLQRLFSSIDSVTARRIISDADVDYDNLLLWLEENVHLNLKTDLELMSGLDALSLADLNLGRIMKSQNWKLLSYVYDFMSVGIVKSRIETPFRRVEYTEPEWPLLFWKGRRSQDKRGRILASLSEVTGVSQTRITKTHYDTVRTLIRRNPREKKTLAKWLGVKSSVFR